jgi:ElaB/YqjD/DUF883 family membrane-anchored ribosome-binding protein
METTYESGQSDFRNSKQRVKGDLAAMKDTASDEFKNFVSDVEDVVKKVANVSDADVKRVSEKVRAAISSTKSGLASSADNIKQQAQQAAKYADNYVRESPWQAVGVGAAIAALLGLSIGYLAARR